MSTKITPAYQWVNEHNSIIKNVLKRYEISNDTGSADWKPGLAGILSMLSDAASEKERVRSYGGKWSLSDVAICGDIVHNSKPLTYYAPIFDSLIVGSPLFDSPKPLGERLFFVQCGAQIMQLNTMLEGKGLALPTTGASNGQTIAGAVSTGTHGSALKVGSMQDYVRALHIVTSGSEHFLVQPSAPLLSNDFAAALGATPLNDDNVFYSALVSFGSFGVIHGLVIETVPLYMLNTSCKRVSFSDAADLFPLLAAYDPADDSAIWNYLQRHGITGEGELHHVDLTINPHADTNNMYLRAMFKMGYDASRLSPLDISQTRVGDDILSIVGKLSDYAGDLIPVITNLLFGQVAQESTNVILTPRNTFGDSTVYRSEQGGTSTEIGLPVGQAAKGIGVIMGAVARARIPGVLGVRFVKPTKAILGFTRFAPLTCTVEVPAVNSQVTIGGYTQVFNALDSAELPFTLHWGQRGDYSPTRLQKMYGDGVKRWNEARAALLPDSFQRYMFSNDFLKGCGLAEEMPLSGGDPIA